MARTTRLALGTAAILSLGVAFAPAAFAQDKMSKDGMKKEDTMSKDGMKKDAMGHDGMKKDGMAKDGMKIGQKTNDLTEMPVKFVVKFAPKSNLTGSPANFCGKLKP